MNYRSNIKASLIQFHTEIKIDSHPNLSPYEAISENKIKSSFFLKKGGIRYTWNTISHKKALEIQLKKKDPIGNFSIFLFYTYIQKGSDVFFSLEAPFWWISFWKSGKIRRVLEGNFYIKFFLLKTWDRIWLRKVLFRALFTFAKSFRLTIWDSGEVCPSFIV